MDIRTGMQLQVSRCIVIYHTLCMQSMNTCMHIRPCETISRASYLGRAIIKASKLKHDCKRLNFAICGTEDHHERAWIIFERGTTYGTILGPRDHLWQKNCHRWSGEPILGGPSVAQQCPTKFYLYEHLTHKYFHTRKFPDLQYY